MNEVMNKLVGRKLYLKWGDHMYVAIEKVPEGDKKLLEMEIAGNPDIILCNMYEGTDGKLSEEMLGPPVYSRAGHPLDMYFRNKEFWMTPGEALSMADPNDECETTKNLK